MAKDPIDEFIALPREQQLSTLQNLSPEKQNKLLDQVKQRRSASKGPAPKSITPIPESEYLKMPLPVGAKGESFGENAHALYHNIGVGAEQAGDAIEHPVRALTGIARSILPAPIEKRIFGSETQNPIQATYEGLNTRPGEEGPAIVGQSIVLDPAVKGVGGAMEAAGRLAPRVGEGLRKGAQSLVGAGSKPVKTIVAKEALEAGEAAKDAIKANREATAKHATDIAAVRDANKEAVRAQSKIAPTQEKLKTAGRELQAQIETARNKALKEGNSKYNTVHAELNPVEADMEKVSSGLQDAYGKISGTQIEPPILRGIEKSMQRGDPLTYEDLQGYYTELGRELSKGTLPGDLYQAYDTMQEAIGDDMQRIADSKGMGGQLKDARAYWRRMKQAFGKPYNPTDAGNAVLEKTLGPQAAAEEQANRIRLLGSFDPTIPQTVDHIRNLHTGLKSLGESKPMREVVNPLPAKPDLETIHPRDVSTRTIRENLLDKWTSGESQLSKFQVRSLVGGGLGAVVGGLFEGRMGAGIGGIVGSTFGPVAIAKLVEMPAVREWLTRPPAGELETLRQLPSADRLRITDTFQKVADQSSKMGKPIKVSPKVTALIVGSQGLAPRQNPTDEWQGIRTF